MMVKYTSLKHQEKWWEGKEHEKEEGVKQRKVWKGGREREAL